MLCRQPLHWHFQIWPTQTRCIQTPCAKRLSKHAPSAHTPPPQTPDTHGAKRGASAAGLSPPPFQGRLPSSPSSEAALSKPRFAALERPPQTGQVVASSAACAGGSERPTGRPLSGTRKPTIRRASSKRPPPASCAARGASMGVRAPRPLPSTSGPCPSQSAVRRCPSCTWTTHARRQARVPGLEPGPSTRSRGTRASAAAPLVAHLLFGTSDHLLAQCSPRPIWRKQVVPRCGDVRGVQGQSAEDLCHDVAGAHCEHALCLEDIAWPEK